MTQHLESDLICVCEIQILYKEKKHINMYQIQCGSNLFACQGETSRAGFKIYISFSASIFILNITTEKGPVKNWIKKALLGHFYH